MIRTKEIHHELTEGQRLDYLEQYYHELVDSSVPCIVKEDILKTVLGV